MRFFLTACMLCLLIASLGCMTNNWSSPLFGENALQKNRSDEGESLESEKPKSNFWTAKFGEGSGLDPRAQEIEKRFGL